MDPILSFLFLVTWVSHFTYIAGEHWVKNWLQSSFWFHLPIWSIMWTNIHQEVKSGPYLPEWLFGVIFNWISAPPSLLKDSTTSNLVLESTLVLLDVGNKQEPLEADNFDIIKKKSKNKLLNKFGNKFFKQISNPKNIKYRNGIISLVTNTVNGAQLSYTRRS